MWWSIFLTGVATPVLLALIALLALLLLCVACSAQAARRILRLLDKCFQLIYGRPRSSLKRRNVRRGERLSPARLNGRQGQDMSCLADSGFAFFRSNRSHSSLAYKTSERFSKRHLPGKPVSEILHS
jgi:hypothetical protein